MAKLGANSIDLGKRVNTRMSMVGGRLFKPAPSSSYAVIARPGLRAAVKIDYVYEGTGERFLMAATSHVVDRRVSDGVGHDWLGNDLSGGDPGLV